MSVHRPPKNKSRAKANLVQTIKPRSTPRAMDARVERNAKRFLRFLFFLFFFCFWTFRYGDFLYMAQEYDLFVWRADYFYEALSRIAGLSRYASSFVIQFFYSPLIGALILSLLGLFSQYAVEKLFGLRRWGFALSFAPACLFALSIVNVNYFLFERVDVAHLFSFTFNYCWALLFALTYDAISSPRARATFFFIAYLVMYPAFGFFALLGAFLCVIKEASRQPSNFERLSDSTKRSKSPLQKRRELCEKLALFTLAIPLLFWFVYSQTTPSKLYMYTAGLWEESTLTESRELEPSNLFTPYILLFRGSSISRELRTNSLLTLYQTLPILFLVIVSAFYSLTAKSRGESAEFNNTPIPLSSMRASIILLALVCSITALGSYNAPNYRALLRVARYLDREEWDAIIREESKVETPINPLISARILALFRTNRISEELFQRPLRPYVSPSLQVVETCSMCGDRMLFEYGITNLATRSAMNNFTTKRDRSTWALKTLTLSAISNEQLALSRKYLFLLQGTLFHRRYANELLDYLDWKYGADANATSLVRAPGTTSKKRLQELNERFETIRRFKPKSDTLSSGRTFDKMLFTLLQKEDFTEYSMPERESYLTLFLLTRNFPRFGELLDQYLIDKGDQSIPRYLQEAILFRESRPGFFSNKLEQSWSPPIETKINPQIRTRSSEFFKSLDPRKTEAELDAQLQSLFGDTFWFFFGSEADIQNYYY